MAATRVLLLLLPPLLAAAAGCGHARPFAVGGPTPPAVETAAVEHRLLLIGDAGDPDPAGEPVLAVLARAAAQIPGRTTVVFLGDNVYETGMPDESPLEGTAAGQILDDVLLNLWESRREAERRLRLQIEAVGRARGIFLPGNHDWDQFGVGGFQRILAQEQYLEHMAQALQRDISMLPGGGCPGPARVDLGPRAALLVLDTQWWLDTGLGGKPRPGHNPTGCDHLTGAAAATALRAGLEAAAREGRVAVVAAHHPLETRGPHGGFYDWKAQLFPLSMLGSYVPVFVRWIPLPGIGSVMTGVRGCCSPNAQDLPARANRRMRRQLADAMEGAAAHGAGPLLYAAGHEHTLQVFRGSSGARFTLVSGLGSSSKASPVGDNERTLFAHAHADHPGFAQVDFLRDGRVRLGVVEYGAQTPAGAEVWSHLLVGRDPRHGAGPRPRAETTQAPGAVRPGRPAVR